MKILGGVANLRANYRIREFLSKLRELTDAGEVVLDGSGDIKPILFEAFEGLFAPDSDAMVLDISKMSGVPLDTVLIDLMMYASPPYTGFLLPTPNLPSRLRYENDELFETALAFMRRRYGQRRALISFLPQITLMNTNRLPVFEDFKCLDQDLQQLRYYMRSYELWATDTIDDSIRDKVVKTLNQLCAFIYAPDDNESLECDDDSVRTRAA